jgi:SAM-dependent methyltransferase
MVCHGELARLKPDPRYLTHFYVMIAAGGALGGLLVGLVAPRLFNALYEMPLGLVACAVLVVAVLRAHPDPAWFRDLLPPARFGTGVLALALAGYLGYRVREVVILAAHRLAGVVVKPGWTAPDWFDTGTLLAALAICAVLMLILLRGPRALQLAPVTVEILALALTGYTAYQICQSTSGSRELVRNFYGGLKVRDNGPATQFDATRTLTHGTINHGEQFLNLARRDLPTTYYGPDTGVGLTIRERGKTKAIRVGVIGLGTGTLASYGRPGDYYRFYEINPLVLRLAHTEFSFLGDCKAKVEVAMGDARLSLEREAPENFDVLAVDAFSSDSIPVHLLTLEAMQLYFRHLRPDGVLAVHISNRYLDLAPVLAGEIRATGKMARLVDTDDDDTQDIFGATWVLITSPASGFHGEELKNSAELESKRTVRSWTDDYSNLFQILKYRYDRGEPRPYPNINRELKSVIQTDDGVSSIWLRKKTWTPLTRISTRPFYFSRPRSSWWCRDSRSRRSI